MNDYYSMICDYEQDQRIEQGCIAEEYRQLESDEKEARIQSQQTSSGKLAPSELKQHLDSDRPF